MHEPSNKIISFQKNKGIAYPQFNTGDIFFVIFVLNIYFPFKIVLIFFFTCDYECLPGMAEIQYVAIKPSILIENK